MKNIDMVGKKFGKLTVIEELPERTKANKKRYKCKCDCGNYHDVVGSSLRSGLTKSCGKCHSQLNIGSKYGKLTVLEYANKKRQNGARIYKCMCECGRITYADVYSLRNGNTKSCGCLANNQGGKSVINKRLHHCWCDMRSRCYNENNKAYKHYGERGIKVCDDWLTNFKTFYDWSMKNGYSDNLTLDRIYVNRNYSPDNCRWVDWETQRNNKRTTIKITINNITRSLKQWCNMLGLNYSMVYSRYRAGKNIIAFLEEVIHESEINKRTAK